MSSDKTNRLAREARQNVVGFEIFCRPRPKFSCKCSYEQQDTGEYILKKALGLTHGVAVTLDGRKPFKLGEKVILLPGTVSGCGSPNLAYP